MGVSTLDSYLLISYFDEKVTFMKSGQQPFKFLHIIFVTILGFQACAVPNATNGSVVTVAAAAQVNQAGEMSVIATCPHRYLSAKRPVGWRWLLYHQCQQWNNALHLYFADGKLSA